MAAGGIEGEILEPLIGVMDNGFKISCIYVFYLDITKSLVECILVGDG